MLVSLIHIQGGYYCIKGTFNHTELAAVTPMYIYKGIVIAFNSNNRLDFAGLLGQTTSTDATTSIVNKR